MTATAVSTSALATMSAAARRSVATGARTNGSAHDGGSAWQAASRSPALGVDTPYCPANVGISDTTIHATHGQDQNTRTATVQPEPPTRPACANTGRNNELTDNSGPAWALAFVRSLLLPTVVRFTVSFAFVLHLENFSVSLSSRFAFDVDADNRVSELKKRIKIARLVIFSSQIPPRG